MLRSPVLPTRRKAVKTYGKTSRSKAALFKVFQDAVDRDDTEKKNWPAITSSPPIIGQQVSGSISDISLTDDLDDPFADHLSLPSIRSKIPDLIANSHHSDKRALKATALREKSTNHPIPIRSAAQTREASEASTISLLRQNINNHRAKKQKFNNTPRVISDAKTPLRPQKYRYSNPTYKQRDFLETQSPTKIRGYISESDGIHSEGPTILGTLASDMDDNASTASVTWVRERARDIFSGTKKAAGKIMGVAPSNAKYRDQKEERPKLKGIIKNGASKGSYGAMNNHLQGSVGLYGYSREPLSYPEDCQNKGSEDENPLGLPRTTNYSRKKSFWRSENIQDLLIGSAKIQYTKKQNVYNSHYATGNEDRNSFQNSVNISPQGSVYDPSDSRLPSSSPLFKSTPNKEQCNSNKNPFYSDADSCKDMYMDGSLNERSSDEGNETTKCDEDELLGENIHHKEEVKRNARPTENQHLIMRAASSEDELYQAPYDCQTPRDTESFRKSVTGNEGGHVRRGVGSCGRGNAKALDNAPTSKTMGNAPPGRFNQQQQHGKDIIHVGGSRTSRYALAKGTVEGAGRKTDKSNRTRIPLKKKSSGRIGKGGVGKETRKQKTSRGYEKLEDDDMDELQMDLPSMMI
ncbi:hypothetical protein DFP73DRAFT_557500 [Morchella snyderi]|nr:hypothetical protein DFP73DRAFT_557500 [Morchella snyderi]